MCSAAWSSMIIASTGAVLSLSDGPKGCNPEIQVIWSRFRMIRGYLSFLPEKIRRIYELLDRASVGSLGHGPIQLLIHSASILE